MKKKFILPTRLIDNDHVYNTDETILLGTWALDKEDLVNSKARHIHEYCYDDCKVLFEDFNYIKKLYIQLLPIVGKVLNDYHGVSWGSRSFKVVYGMWLHDYLPVMRERYQTVSSAIKSYPSHSFILTKQKFNIHSSKEFKEKITQDDYNHFIYTKIVKFISNTTYDQSHFLSSNNHQFSLTHSYTNRIKLKLKDSIIKKLQIFINFSTKKSLAVVDRSYFSISDFFKLIKNSKRKITPLIYFPKTNKDKAIFSFSTRVKLKEKLKKEYSPQNRFEEFIINNIFYDAPLSFIENFNQLINESRIIKLRDKNYLSSNAILSNQVLQFAVASQMKSRNKLIIPQHGGSYGIARWSSQQFWETDMADVFISFGWVEDDRSNILPLSHPKLILNSRENAQGSKKVLYITNGSSRYFNRNWAHPSAGKSTIRYYKYMMKFIQNLNPLVKDNLYLRLSPSVEDYGLDVRTFLNNCIKLSDGNFYKELLSSALIVCDHNQTSFLESLANNIPTIFFWDSKYTQISNKAKPYFDELMTQGIFYTSPSKAADCINTLINNNSISEWWMDGQRQAAIASFTKQYAKINNNWIKDYSSELYEI